MRQSLLCVILACGVLSCRNGSPGGHECVGDACVAGEEPDGGCQPSEDIETSCGDSIDNDCDGAFDGDDLDCGAVRQEICDDGVDNDDDGASDCADEDCSQTLACASCEGASIELCDQACIDTAIDPRYCGGCARSCDPGQVCQAGSCVTIDDCRDTPCTGFSYCDLARGTCQPGCTGDDLCFENEACNLSTHGCECIGGTHRCAGLCISNDSPQHCGQSCSPCPTIDHGRATCDGRSCGLTCEASYHMCGDQCVPNDSIETCGASCTPCENKPNAETSCDGQQCSWECHDGYRFCEDTGRCEQCCQDDECAEGEVCESPSAGARPECMPGCHEHSQCGEDEFCSPSLECTHLSGSGWCTSHMHCELGQYCQYESFRCVDATTYRCSFADGCGSSSYACLNYRCVPKEEITICTGWSDCPNNSGCSPIDFTCYDPSYNCSDYYDSCGPGLECTRNQYNDPWRCFPPHMDYCGYDCYGGDCVDDTCMVNGAPCDDDFGCRFEGLICVEGQCERIIRRSCSSDEDCSDPITTGVCITEIGRCTLDRS